MIMLRARMCLYVCRVEAVSQCRKEVLRFKFVANHDHRKGQDQNYPTGSLRKNESRAKKKERNVDVVGRALRSRSCTSRFSFFFK